MNYKSLITKITNNDPKGFYFDSETVRVYLDMNLTDLKIPFKLFEDEFTETYYEMFPNREHEFILVSTTDGDILAMREF